jgi:hypothetical protein
MLNGTVRGALLRTWLGLALVAGCAGDDTTTKDAPTTGSSDGTTPTTDTEDTSAPTGTTPTTDTADCLAAPYEWGTAVATGATTTFTGSGDPSLARVVLDCAGDKFQISVETAGLTSGGTVTLVAASSDLTQPLSSLDADPYGWWEQLGYAGGTGCDAHLACVTFLVALRNPAGDFDSCAIVGPKADELLAGTIRPASTPVDPRDCTAL